MASERFPLAEREVTEDVARARSTACHRCSLVVIMMPDTKGPRPPHCGIPDWQRDALGLTLDPKLYGSGKPLDHANPNGPGYGWWGSADENVCPIGKWTVQALELYMPKEPTAEELTASEAKNMANVGRQLDGWQVDKVRLVKAVEQGLPLWLAKQIAQQKGLVL